MVNSGCCRELDSQLKWERQNTETVLEEKLSKMRPGVTFWNKINIGLKEICGAV